MKDEKKYKHPAYGQIEFTRTSSNVGNEFYGSKLKQGNYITMTVSESEHKKLLSSDYYY